MVKLLRLVFDTAALRGVARRHAGAACGTLSLTKDRQPFNPEVFAQEEAKMKRRKLARLQNLAASLNYQLVPQP